MSKNIIFVYGTLKRGFPLHLVLEESKFLGMATSVYKYPMIANKFGTYPFLIDLKGKGNYIKGEIFEITNEVFSELDKIEGVPNLFVRAFIDVHTNDGEQYHAIAYVRADNYIIDKSISLLKNWDKHE